MPSQRKMGRHLWSLSECDGIWLIVGSGRRLARRYLYRARSLEESLGNSTRRQRTL